MKKSVRILSLFTLALCLTGCFGRSVDTAPYVESREDRVYYLDGEPLAEVQHIGSLPVVFLYTEDPYWQGRALAYLRFHANRRFFVEYVRPLTYWLRFTNLSHFFQDPMKRILQEANAWDYHYPTSFTDQAKGMIDEILSWSPDDEVSVDHLKALATFGDVYKGIACSSALRKEEGQVTLMRNLDWPSQGILGADTFALVYPIAHPREAGPQAVISITFPPGYLGLSMANDKGLVVTLNEACDDDSKRQCKGGIPEMLLIREIVENCATLAEVEAFLTEHPAASSHILSVRDREGKAAIFQMLPCRTCCRYTQRVLTDTYIHATNHFYDVDGSIIKESEGFDDSRIRYRQMKQALDEHADFFDVLAAVNVDDTLQAMVFRDNKEEGFFELCLAYDNYDAACSEYESSDLDSFFDLVKE